MIELSDHFNCRRLLRYTFPSIVMVIFTSVYGVVDGFFVSNFAGKTQFAAVNFIMPVLIILGCLGFMFGTGGSALIAKTIGDGNGKKAKEIFSMLVCVSVVLGVLLAVCGVLILRPVAAFMGADGQLLDDCVLYGRIILLILPFYILQSEFQCLFVCAQKPKQGLFVTVAAGIINMILDAVLVAGLSLGLVGAAAATAFSQLVGGIIPLIYFSHKNSSLLRFCKFTFDFKALIKICSNGASEFVNNISLALIGMIYNVKLMKSAGENGVAAYGVLMYVSMIFQSVFIGYSVGSAPIFSYHHGADNRDELKSLLKKSIIIISVSSVVMFVSGELLGGLFSSLFVGYNKELFDMTAHAFSIFSFSFIFVGTAVFGSSYFTALNDGLTSAMLSFMRTFVFQVGSVLILPILLGLDGIWWSLAVAEALSAAVTVLFIAFKKRRIAA